MQDIKNYKMSDTKKLSFIDFNSLKTILFFGLVIRLIAAIFSQGYGMHDDHFVIIETASSWSDGIDNSEWLPWTKGNKGAPEGHSFTYVGLNYFFFYIIKLLGVSDPKILMLLNRLVHGAFSLLVIYFGFRITEKISNRKNAVIVGWLLALISVMPFLAVRNLVELTSIPFLMWGVWLIINKGSNKALFYAGMLIGIAVSFRYQIAVFTLGIGFYYLIKKEIKALLVFGLGSFVTFFLTQGVVDYFIWGYPFAEFIGYATYNMVEGTKYLPNSNYFMYFWVLMGVLLFPLGILVLIGFFRSVKNQLFIFIPTFAFVLFHTFYPNRQERFVLSVLPFFIILGVIGYEKLKEKAFWSKLWKGSLVAFWCLNIPLLIALSFHYSKKSRVEAMYALYGNGMESEHILLEGTRSTKPSMMPKFYADSWDCSFRERTDSIQALKLDETSNFDYVFFFGKEDLNSRISEYKEIYPQLELIEKCDPSFIDKVARKLNPRNSNQYIEVWKTNY